MNEKSKTYESTPSSCLLYTNPLSLSLLLSLSPSLPSPLSPPPPTRPVPDLEPFDHLLPEDVGGGQAGGGAQVLGGLSQTLLLIGVPRVRGALLGRLGGRGGTEG